MDDDRSRFNGAVVFQRRNRRSWLAWLRGKLQWGRRLSTTETRGDTAAMSLRSSSMGRRLSTTETMRLPTSDNWLMQLQWGRRLSTTETKDGTVIRARLEVQASMGPSSFNDGLAFLSKSLRAKSSASMGPSSLTTETANPQGLRDTCFNGAVVFQRRKLSVVCLSHVLFE
ncbi:MAG: hypothetical protein R3C17_06230 [Planctomycetaceae bacterium]